MKRNFYIVISHCHFVSLGHEWSLYSNYYSNNQVLTGSVEKILKQIRLAPEPRL